MRWSEETYRLHKLEQTYIHNINNRTDMNNTGRIALGLALGAAIGAAITYLSDRDKRDRLYDDLSTTADRTRDSLVEGYYEAKDRFETYRDKLQKRGAKFAEEVEEQFDETMDKAKETASKAKETVEEAKKAVK